MKIKEFREHQVTRSTPGPYLSYSSYKPALERDFHHRCAYCNLSSKTITTPFEVDHFIPKAIFKSVRPELNATYTNLVYSCKKCNLAKSDQYQGDISITNPTNELFYDPGITDYNRIFYRNELGAIDSDDPKGRDAIIRLKLYRQTHILAWVCEQLFSICQKLQKAIDLETDNDQRQKQLQESLSKMQSQYIKYQNIFTATYNITNSSQDKSLLSPDGERVYAGAR